MFTNFRGNEFLNFYVLMCSYLTQKVCCYYDWSHWIVKFEGGNHKLGDSNRSSELTGRRLRCCPSQVQIRPVQSYKHYYEYQNVRASFTKAQYRLSKSV